jgi:heat shock protein HslJ
LPTTAPVDPAELIGHTYVAIEATEDGQAIGIVPETRLVLGFSDASRFGADSGCNAMGGDYEIRDGRLVTANMHITAMACTGAIGRQEGWYYTFLLSSPTISRASTSLVLANDDVVVTYADETVALPNPGGTCTVSQLLIHESAIVGQPASLGTAHVLLTLPVENSGADCVLALPEVIGLASRTGPLTAVDVPNLGITVCEGDSCHHEYPASFSIRAGQRFDIRLNAWWWLPTADAPSHAPCGHLIADVSRVAFPVSDRTIDLAWATSVFHEVCAAPPSISVGVETK